MQLVYTVIFQFSIINLILVPVIGYSFSWTGHFLFEQNKPAAFVYPWLSFCGDMKMVSEILSGVRRF